MCDKAADVDAMSWFDAVKLSCEACLLHFHISVLLCILKEKRSKNVEFTSPFYTFYILQSVFDIVFVLVYAVCTGLASFGILVPFVNFGLSCGTYGQLGQGIAHAVIACHRFTAIVLPYRNKQIWTGRSQMVACGFALLAPLPVVVVKLHVQYAFVYVSETGGYLAIGTNERFVMLNGFLVLGYDAVIALISCVLEVVTFIAYYRLSRSAQLTRRDDYKLLVYAMTQMVGQILAALCALNLVIKTLSHSAYSPVYAAYLYHITVDLLGLSGPICLLITRRGTGLANFGILVPFVNFGLASGVYGQLGQAIAHALISGNRFTAIVVPYWNKRVWTRTRMMLAFGVAFVAPLPVFVVKMNMQYRFVFVEETATYLAVGSNQLYVALNGFLTFAYISTLALFSFVLEVATFVIYYRLSRESQLTRRDDYKLLVYAMTQMVGQFLAALCASHLIVKTLFDFAYFLVVVPYLFHITVDVLGLTGPICLLLTSGLVRSSYQRFIFGRRSQREIMSIT